MKTQKKPDRGASWAPNLVAAERSYSVEFKKGDAPKKPFDNK